MLRTLLRSKIHRARVTQADLNYEGSITIDSLLLDAAQIIPFEKVDIYNVTNGNRLSTYVIPGKRGSGSPAMTSASCAAPWLPRRSLTRVRPAPSTAARLVTF